MEHIKTESGHNTGDDGLDNHGYGVDNHGYGPDSEGYDSSVPSWIRLLDSPRFKQNGVPSRPQPALEESIDQPVETAKDPEPWYVSPIFDQPVTGYHNRFSQSEPALDYPFRQSATAYHGRPGQSLNNTYDCPLYGQTEKADWSNYLDTYSETAAPTAQNILDQSYISQQSPHQYPGVSDNNHFPTMASGYSLAASNDRLTSHSRDQPELLKPEDYLSGLQSDSYSVKYVGSPCGRCTCAVTAVIVLMSLAIIGLAAALTTSVIMKKDSGDSQLLVEGFPVVRAFVDLKILNMNFTQAMADPTSPDFYSIARPYSKELDRLFLTSSFKDAYLGNRILSLAPGSIKTRAELMFSGNDAVKDGKDVENVIDSAQRAQNWQESDAREMGQFVVCGDCVTVSLDSTRRPRLPTRPVLAANGTATDAPGSSTSMTSSTGSGLATPAITPETSTAAVNTLNATLSTSRVSVSNSTPFLEDGHFVVACDVTHPGNWVTLTLGFKPENSSFSHTDIIVTLTHGELDPVVSSKYQSRVSAYADVTLSSDVSVVMNVTMVTCADRGDYVCRVSMQNGRQFSSTGRVALQELPSVPVLKETTNSAQWDATPVYVCTARLGYPPGQMLLSVVRGENETLRSLPAHVTYQDHDCEASAELQISLLDSRLLGNASRVLCQVFSDHLRLLDATQYSTYRQVALPRKLEIQTKSASVNEGLAGIRCRLLNIDSWQRLTLLKVTSLTENIELVSALPDGSLDWNNFYLRHRSMSHVQVSTNQVDMDIFIYSLKCTDEGVYSCVVKSDSYVSMTRPEAFLEVRASPSSPTLIMPMGAVENALSQYPIICNAHVGRPAGSLILKVKNQGETRFRELAFNERTTTTFSCTTEMRGMYYPTEAAISNGSTLLCHVIPYGTLRDVDTGMNVSDTFNIIPAGHCQNKGDRNITHPTSCRHYVTCKNDVIVNTTECKEDLCFDPSSATCSVKTPVDTKKEDKPGPCYPDKDDVMADKHLCHVFYQCDSGRNVIHTCPAGTLYASNMACTPVVKESQCYRDLDMSVGIRVNSSHMKS